MCDKIHYVYLVELLPRDEAEEPVMAFVAGHSPVMLTTDELISQLPVERRVEPGPARVLSGPIVAA